MLKYNFPENLKKLRKINKLSQLDLAEKLGVTRQSISYYENGNAEPSINFIIQLSSLFNCSIDSLLFEEHDTDLLDKKTLEHINKAHCLINLNFDIVDCNRIINLLENKKVHLYKTIDDLNDLIIYMKKYNARNNNTEFAEELSPSIEFINSTKKNICMKEIKENNLFIIKIKDESMNKLYKINDYVLCTKECLTDKKYPFVVLVDGELTIKYVESNNINNTFTLIPNSTLNIFKPTVYSYDKHNLEILGSAIDVIELKGF